MRRNMPGEIPGIHLGRLAVDQQHQGHKLARALLMHAISISKLFARQIAARALFVHALNDEATAFYRYFGFKLLPVETVTLALDLLDFDD